MEEQYYLFCLLLSLRPASFFDAVIRSADKSLYIFVDVTNSVFQKDCWYFKTLFHVPIRGFIESKLTDILNILVFQHLLKYFFLTLKSFQKTVVFYSNLKRWAVNLGQLRWYNNSGFEIYGQQKEINEKRREDIFYLKLSAKP